MAEINIQSDVIIGGIVTIKPNLLKSHLGKTIIAILGFRNEDAIPYEMVFVEEYSDILKAIDRYRMVKTCNTIKIIVGKPEDPRNLPMGKRPLQFAWVIGDVLLTNVFCRCNQMIDVIEYIQNLMQYKFIYSDIDDMIVLIGNEKLVISNEEIDDIENILKSAFSSENKPDLREGWVCI